MTSPCEESHVPPIRPAFPFSAVVGADDAKLALLLATIQPTIGGVLLTGDKGAAKTTLARGLAVLTGADTPFVDLPLGATEERVVGSLDLAAALTGGGVRVQPGLLAAADGGVLYVDEVNLLADHLVDVLLDVAVSGVNRIERDGVSHVHPARFVLVGSMNPEEGDLRPQLLDRFGLAVDVRGSADPAVRAEAMRRRLDFDADPHGFTARWAESEQELRTRLERCRPASLDDRALRLVAEVCVAAGAEGLRADLVMARAAAAHAGWHERGHVTEDDIRVVAPLVLGHRALREPGDAPRPPAPPDLDRAIDDVLDRARPAPAGPGDVAGEATNPPAGSPPEPEPGQSGSDSSARDDRGAGGQVDDAGPTVRVVPLAAAVREQATASGRRSPVVAPHGRSVGHDAAGSVPSALAPVATLAAAAQRWATDPGAARSIETEDLRAARRTTRTGNLLVLAVDASGSMGASERMTAVKGALLGLLVDAYQRRDRVALVTFGGDGARTVLRPTASIEVARTRLQGLPTGGDTPLAEGISAALQLALTSASPVLQPLLVVVTDGRGTAGPDPFGAAIAAAREVGRLSVPAVVLDVEAPGPGRLGLARELAAAMGGRHLPLEQLSAGHLEAALRRL